MNRVEWVRAARIGSWLSWLKTTTSADVGQEGRDLAATARLLTFYSVETKRLRGLLKAKLWHGSCFSLCRAFHQLCWIGFWRALWNGSTRDWKL
jgi:hypothetical protein